MTDIGSPVTETSFARLDALAERGRRRGSVGDGQSFDQLVAEAKSRLMSRISTGVPPGPGYDTKPAGALGMATPAASTAPLPSTAPTVEPTAPAAESTAPAAESTAPLAEPAEQVAPLGSTRSVARTTSASTDPSITKATMSEAGESILAAALDQVDASYSAGGDDPETGFDNAGLVRYAHRSVGVEMPTAITDQATMGVAIESLDDALPGDVITFGTPANHVAIYAGDQNIVHAPSAGETVRVENIERPVESIRRVVMPGPASPTLDEFTPGQMEQLYRPLFDAAGLQWEVAPELLAAIAEVESGFDPKAVSPAGAQGLMQFMPATAREMSVDPWDPASAIDGAARYLRTSLDQFEQPDLAIASYNAGRGAVSRYGGIPPFNETQNYVQKVLEAWRNRS